MGWSRAVPSGGRPKNWGFRRRLRAAWPAAPAETTTVSLSRIVRHMRRRVSAQPPSCCRAVLCWAAMLHLPPGAAGGTGWPSSAAVEQVHNLQHEERIAAWMKVSKNNEQLSLAWVRASSAYCCILQRECGAAAGRRMACSIHNWRTVFKAECRRFCAECRMFQRIGAPTGGRSTWAHAGELPQHRLCRAAGALTRVG